MGFAPTLVRTWSEFEANEKRRQLDEKKHCTYDWIYLINREKLITRIFYNQELERFVEDPLTAGK